MPRSIHTREHRAFVAVIREIREEVGLTQVQLAQRSGENQAKISNIERGERRVDIVELRRLCRALDTTLAEFVDRFEGRLRRRRSS